MIPVYQYKAEVLSVYDGDTITLKVDAGFHISFTLSARLYGIGAPELRATGGSASRSHLMLLIGMKDATPTSNVYLQTIKDRTEKYGRYLAVLFRGEVGGVLSINQLMIDDGFAVPYMPTPGPALGTL